MMGKLHKNVKIAIMYEDKNLKESVRRKNTTILRAHNFNYSKLSHYNIKNWKLDLSVTQFYKTD